MTEKQQALLDEALSESGIVPFHKDDEPLVAELCEIIGILYRELSAFGPLDSHIKSLK